MKVGILTAGGDCPGLNAAIRGVGKTLIMNYGAKVYGISSGFLGLIENEYTELKEENLSNILTMGGTILGTSREKPFKKASQFLKEIDKPRVIKDNYEQMGLDALVCIGGNGTMNTASKLAEEGLNIIGLPKTIDNDIFGTEFSFGFSSAVNIATEAIDRLHTTANAHRRIMIIETMGHKAGWLALHAGIAGGGDVILIPEIPYDIDNIAKYLQERYEKDKHESIIVVAEGIRTKNGKPAGAFIKQELNKRINQDLRETVLGYIQRGGTPSPLDRLFATRFGAYAAKLIADENYNRMVAVKAGEITDVPIAEIAGKLKLVGPDDPLVMHAKQIGTCFGDS